MSGKHFFTGQVLCSSTCPIEHIDIPGDDDENTIKEPERGWPDASLSALNNLQADKSEWLSDTAIEVAVREYHAGLAPAVQRRVDVQHKLIDAEVFVPGRRGEDALSKLVARKRDRLWRAMREAEYSIFPVNTRGNHWVTVVLHKELCQDNTSAGAGAGAGSEDTGAGKKQQHYGHVTGMAVVDPFRDSQRVALVTSRMESLLKRAAGFTFAEDYQRSIWSPHQPDISSCGPRSYWCAKQLLDRVQALYEAGRFYDETFWDHLSGWFDEAFVRGEMIGRAAWAGVKDMDYRARVAVECVNRVRRYGDRSVNPKWRSAAQTVKPTSSSSSRAYEKRPRDEPPQGEEPAPKRRSYTGPPASLRPGAQLPRLTEEERRRAAERLPSAMAVDNNAYTLSTGQPHKHAVASLAKPVQQSGVSNVARDLSHPADSSKKKSPTWAAASGSGDADMTWSSQIDDEEAEGFAEVVALLYDPDGNLLDAAQTQRPSEDDPVTGFNWAETF
ncbi:hypothetical protein F5Y17DRAFT_251142 [Xylariaceae sp. FL0594]|nr:hypothetical protein F5Y17DRAFT_251142 [Xylariaceae sp. FL0594]